MTEHLVTILTTAVPSVANWGEKPSGETFDTIIQSAHDWLFSFLPFLGRGAAVGIIAVLFVFLGAWAVLAWIRGH